MSISTNLQYQPHSFLLNTQLTGTVCLHCGGFETDAIHHMSVVRTPEPCALCGLELDSSGECLNESCQEQLDELEHELHLAAAAEERRDRNAGLVAQVLLMGKEIQVGSSLAELALIEWMQFAYRVADALEIARVKK